MPDTPTHRLAAILAADVAGYLRLTGATTRAPRGAEVASAQACVSVSMLT
jgi:hypothetical protein